MAIDKKIGKMAGFLNGIATDEEEFRDEFFTDASLHNPNGKTVMLLGLDVLPEYRMQGLARELVYHYCRKEKENGRQRLVLTYLDNKVEMYKKFGFRDLGECASQWGGEKWLQHINIPADGSQRRAQIMGNVCERVFQFRIALMIKAVFFSKNHKLSVDTVCECTHILVTA